MRKKTFKEVLRLFNEQGRTDILICSDGFEGWKDDKKSKFYDLVEKDYFYGIPYKVYTYQYVHPNRLTEKKSIARKKFHSDPIKHNNFEEKRKNTNLERYGFDHPLKVKEFKEKRVATNIRLHGVTNNLQAPAVKEQIKATNLERYGFEHPMKSTIIKDKVRETNFITYGVYNPGQAESVQQKMKETNLQRYGNEYAIASSKVIEKIKQVFVDKYGVESSFLIPGVQDKIKQIFLDKYGTEYPLISEEIRDKAKKTTLERYGVEHNFKINARKILGTNQTISEWLEEQSEPKPHITTIYRYFIGEDDMSESVLLDYISNYKDSKTSLEYLGENVFDLKHYNRKINDVNMKYRPDFMLSDSIYVNVDGLYWHSEKWKNDDYHFNMRQDFESNNLRLLQFYEDEMRDKSLIVKFMIDSILEPKVYITSPDNIIRKEIGQSIAIQFLNDNHIMGEINGSNVGLYDSTEPEKLLSIITYKIQNNVCNILRFCNLIGYNSENAFDKLLSFITDNNKNILHVSYWSNLRYEHFEENNFIPQTETQSWRWTDSYNTYFSENCERYSNETNLFSEQHALEMGWYKIYDAGQRLFIRYL